MMAQFLSVLILVPIAAVLLLGILYIVGAIVVGGIAGISEAGDIFMRIWRRFHAGGHTHDGRFHTPVLHH